MYQENGGFDQSNSMHGVGLSEDSFSQTHLPNCNNFSMDEQPYPQTDVTAAAVAAASALEMELQHQLEIEQCYGTKNCAEIQDMVHESTNWQEMAENGQYHHHHHQNPAAAADFNQIYAATASMADAAAPYPTAPDLLNIFPLPRCSPSSLLPNFPPKSPAFLASLGLLGDHVGGDGSAASNGVVYDPLLPLNLPPQPPLLRELFHSLPHEGGVYMRNGGGLFTSGVDEREANVGLYQNGDGFEFRTPEIAKNRDNNGNKDTKHFATEKHRRVLLNDKYGALRSLVPCPTKNDRASTVHDAIKYINELKRTVAELEGLVEKKRCARERLKRPKVEGDGSESKFAVGDVDGSSPLRSSWLHRKSKNTEVDVRIIDDEVTVKLVQQKRINCVLCVSKVLDELQLDLHHVAGGLIGDYYSYLFNSKICEGSMIYASAVANKLIEVVDKQYAAAVPPTTTTSY